jgi:hypothetical protein
MLFFLIKIILGYLFADFLTGIYHWIKDSYFSPFTPLIGRKFIWMSRLHHVRPKYVTEISDYDLLKSSSLWTLLWMWPLFLWYGLDPFLLTLLLFISLNDVIHKYAHLEDSERPIWATYLQVMKFVQSPSEHYHHHHSLHDKYYCPITPYVNAILEPIHFWRIMEYLIEKIIGVKARSHRERFVEDHTYPAGIKFIEHE